MRNKKVSLRGALVRDMMKDMMETAMGHRFQTGAVRKNPREPVWICPEGCEYEIVDMDEFRMEYLHPAGIATGRVILQLHGGGYIGPMKNIYRDFAKLYSRYSMGADVLTVDYRVAPEHPYPAALEDALEAYRWLIQERRYKAKNIIVAGDSAGGGLAFALVMYLRDHRAPLPGGIIAMSPWADLTCSGESYETNYTRDPQFGNTRDSMLYNCPYVGGADPRDPYISPVFGKFTRMPPVLLQAGSEEMLLSDTLTLAGKLRREKGKLRVSVYDGMFHVFQMAYRLIPDARDAWEEVETFLHRVYRLQKEPGGRKVRMVRNSRTGRKP